MADGGTGPGSPGFSLDFLFTDADGMVHWRNPGINTLVAIASTTAAQGELPLVPFQLLHPLLWSMAIVPSLN